MSQNINQNYNTYISSTINNTQTSSCTHQIEDPPELFGLPHLSEAITGRDTDVKHLLASIKRHHKCLITGIAGIGKTTLSTLCARTWVRNEEFKYAVFVNSETDNSAETVFRALAAKIFKNSIFIDGTISEVFKHYNKQECNTIFILDNITQKSNIHKYLPDKELKNIFVLGTAQFTELKGIFQLHELNKLSIESSVEMIKKILLNNDIKIPTNNNKMATELLTDLAKTLDYHPLALEHAAAYNVDSVRNGQIPLIESIQQYIKTFSEKLKQEPPTEHSTTYRTPVHIALEINIEKAITKNEDVRTLLFCMSFLDPTKIYMDMFYRMFGDKHIKILLRELKKYSIISLKEMRRTTIISLHRLIQLVCRNLIKNVNKENDYLQIVLNIFFYYDDDNDVFIRHQIIYLTQNLTIDKETMSNLYIKSFQSNDNIKKHLTAKLKLIHCNMDDIKDWSALHCSVFAGHELFFEYFDDMIECTNIYKHGMAQNVNDKWTVYHAQIIKNSGMNLFSMSNNPLIHSRNNSMHVYLESNPDKKNKKIINGLTSLHLSAAFGVSKGSFDGLINIGCDINIRDNNGMTPILWAAKNMAYYLVFTLHRKGATYDRSYKELLSAASDGDHELALELLQKNTINCAASDFGKLLLWWAVDNKHYNLASELINRRTDVNIVNVEGDTLLHLVAKYGNIDLTAKLINQNAHIDIENNSGETPLLAAVRGGHSEVAIKLMCSGANINTVDNNGNTPLLLASNRKSSGIAFELIRRGATINTINNAGDTPLLGAAKRGHSDLVIELINRGAYIEATNDKGDTPLLMAIRMKRTECATELIRRDANIHIVNDRGDTPLSLALRNENRALEELLIEYGATTGSE